MANLGKVVYLTEAQAQTLFANGSITVGGVTVTYSANDIYVTPTISGGLIAVQDQTPTDPNTQIWLPETQPQSVNLAELSDIPDVQINGTSIVSNGVANVPLATNATPGVAFFQSSLGLYVGSNGSVSINAAGSTYIKDGTYNYYPLTPQRQHEATFYGLAKAAGYDEKNSTNAVGTYTPQAKAAIQSMLGVNPGVCFVETVSGTTPTITGEANVRYICGEVTSISITPPVSGTIDVRFTSGTTPTVLTLPGTVIFPSGVDLTMLDASTVYEIMITDGVYGGVMTWPV